MQRSTVIAASSAALGVAVALGALQMRATNDAGKLDVDSIVAPPETSPPTSNAAQMPAIAVAEPDAPLEATTTPSAEDIEHWITNTASPDARLRAAAIASLADAPKAQALRALERVLEAGEPGIDRQIALRSLHKLALQQGDDDGRVRDALRGAVYHGDDEGVADSARAFLEDIEAEFASRESG